MNKEYMMMLYNSNNYNFLGKIMEDFLNINNGINFCIAISKYFQYNGWLYQYKYIRSKLYKCMIENINNLIGNKYIQMTKEIREFIDFCENIRKLTNNNCNFSYDYIIDSIELMMMYIRNGFIIFPCKLTKEPMIKGWNMLSFKKSITNLIYKPIGINSGLLCGKESNVMVLDIDNNDEGKDYWNKLIAENGDIDTLKVITGSGGFHYYFKYEDDFYSRNRIFSVDKKKIGIDFKSDNGYVIVPLSGHLKSGALYKFEDKNKEIKKMPKWLHDKLIEVFKK